MAITANYGWARPNREGLQRAEIGKIEEAFVAADATVKTIDDGLAALLASFTTHTHSFASLTGKPTTLAGYGITDAYTMTAADAKIAAAVAALVGGAPGQLDALNELATAIGNDPNFAATMTALIGTKLNASAYTAADVIAKLLTVDGAGSGLDADKLDNQSGDYYRDLANAIGQFGMNVLIATVGSPKITLRDIGGGSPTAAVGYIEFKDYPQNVMGWMGFGSSGNADMSLYNAYGNVRLLAAGSEVLVASPGRIFGGASFSITGQSGDVDHTLVARPTNPGLGGVIGYTQDASAYGILGYANLNSFVGLGEFQNTGNAKVIGNVTATGILYCGNGSASLNDNGNPIGPVWNAWGGYSDAFNATLWKINSQSAAAAQSPGNAQLANAGITAGAIGSYGMFRVPTGTYGPGATFSGSSLLWADNTNDNGTSPGGSWRLMGSINGGGTSLFLRYA